MAFKGASTAKATTSKTGQRAPAKKKKAAPKKKAVKKKAAPKPKKAKAPKAPKPKKKSKTRQKLERKLETKLEKAALAAASRPTRALGTAARAVGSKAIALGAGGAASGLATLGVAGSAAALTVAFALGYGIGTAARAVWNYLSEDERRFRQARAFRKAREDFEKQVGRKPNAAEVKEIGKAFLDAVHKDQGVRDGQGNF